MAASIYPRHILNCSKNSCALRPTCGCLTGIPEDVRNNISKKPMKTSTITLAAILLALPLHAGQPDAATPPSSATIKLHNFAELDKRPNPVYRQQPLYPAELKAARVTGEAVIAFVVDVDGSVKDARIVKATEPAFGEAALAAVSTWKFEPGMKNGSPVACQLSMPLRFALSN